MSAALRESVSVVSPRVYAQILTSPIGAQLLPEGLFGSPYEVLDYRSALVLHDHKGRTATFTRTQRIRFLQDGVSAILDHCWGAGLLLAEYRHSGGSIGETFKDEGRRHLVIRLKRAMRRGEELRFTVERTVLVGFTEEREQLETTIDHPVQRIALEVVFPRERPGRSAVLELGDESLPMPVLRSRWGRTLLHVQILGAQAHTPYVIRWTW